MDTGKSANGAFTPYAPTNKERAIFHAKMFGMQEALGIEKEIGAYVGTKSCNDIEFGMYVPSTGLVRPCPGYENNSSIKGDLNNESIVDIWESNNTKKQQICNPKAGTVFAKIEGMSFEQYVQYDFEKNGSIYVAQAKDKIQRVGLY